MKDILYRTHRIHRQTRNLELRVWLLAARHPQRLWRED